jgi:hypothetical protein
MVALEEGQFVKCDNNLGPMPFRPWLTDEFVQLGFKSHHQPALQSGDYSSNKNLE